MHQLIRSAMTNLASASSTSIKAIAVTASIAVAIARYRTTRPDASWGTIATFVVDLDNRNLVRSFAATARRSSLTRIDTIAFSVSYFDIDSGRREKVAGAKANSAAINAATRRVFPAPSVTSLERYAYFFSFISTATTYLFIFFKI